MSLDKIADLLAAQAASIKYEHWRHYVPAPKHLEFFAAGATFMERGLIAGNGCGKTECAAFELSRHLTGVYPDWWPGRRYDRPVRVFLAGTSGADIRDAAQHKLCGTPGVESDFGSGMIPRDAFAGKPATSRGIPDGYDSFQIKHAVGGVSRLVVRTYQQDRRDWQGSDQDIFAPDEECPLELYSEGMARLRGRGMAMTTFTPLMGYTPLVSRFLEESDPTRMVVRMTLADCPWYSDQERQNMVASYQPHEREARINGYPMLGEGAVFTTPVSDLLWPTMRLEDVPRDWCKIWGVDFGIGHPFAAVLMAWDREDDVVYVLRTIRMKDALVLQHAEAMRRLAANVPVAWPHDGHVRDRNSGEELAAIYRKTHGLQMLQDHATHLSGGYATEPGVLSLDDRMHAGKFRVDASCRDWFEEYQTYHRKNGMLVKERDDLMSATRIAHMMLRRARPVALGFQRRRAIVRAREAPVCDPWSGMPIR